MKTLLLLPLLALMFAACGGAQQNFAPTAAASSSPLPPGPTGTRPSTPTGVTATATPSGLAINLSWNASTGIVAVTGYIVRRNGTPIATPAATSYSDTTGLNAGTTYRYTVAAVDANGNNSFLSTSASATTAGTPPPGGIPSALGWFQIPNTQIASVCAVTQGFPEVAGLEGCTAITEDWSGGALDTARNRLLIWGGGHSGYAGNEVYALELDTLSMVRLDNPSTPVTVRPADCTGFSNPTTYADGNPSSRHTYNQLAYLPNLDAMFAWGGSQWPCGFFADDTWLLNFPGLSWTQKSHVNVPSRNYGRAMSLDPNTNLVYARDDFHLFSYDPVADTWTTRSTSFGMDDNKNAVVDPVRKKYFLHTNASGATLYWYDVSSPTAASLTIQSAQTTGCSGFIGNYQAGMEYDPIQDRIVGWSGGNTVYILNPDTFSCTTSSSSGGPTTVSAQGTWGRFRYSPSLNVFVVCNSVNENCYSLRLTP